MYDEELVDPTRRLELLDSSSSIDHLLAGTRIGKNAFAGIVPVYDTHLFHRRGRQKVSVLWGEQVIDGIKHDSVELVRGALGYPFSNAEERLEAAGPAGAPFSFANAAIFTQEQIDRVVDDLRLRTREANAKTKRFVSDSEWVDIDQALGETGTYASVFMSKATSGDTGLHIAMILGRLRAAQVFVEEGCDATILNDEGVSVVSILSENFDKIMILVQRIGQLEEDNSRRGPGARRLTAEEKACLAQQERVVKKANEYRLFAHGLACYFVDRLADWLALQEEERACEIEGRDMHPAAKRELRLCEVMRSYLEQCEAVRDLDQDQAAGGGGGGDLLPPLTQEELDSKAERFTGIVTPRRRARGAGGGGGRGCDDRAKNQARGPISGELKASLASRMGVCMTATSHSEDSSSCGSGGGQDEEGELAGGGGRGGGVSDGDDGGGGREEKNNHPTDGRRQQRRRQRRQRDNEEEEKTGRDHGTLSASVGGGLQGVAESSTLASSQEASTAATRSDGKGITARIAAAQKQASNRLNAITTASNAKARKESPIDARRAAGAAATASELHVRSKSGTTAGPRGGYHGGGDGDGSMPPPFQGRSLMSAAWLSKSEEPGAAGRRGHPRYATKGLTPGSWTATDRSPSNPVDGETKEEGVGAGGTGREEGGGGRGRHRGGGGGGGCVGLGSGAGYLSGQPVGGWGGEHADMFDEKRGGGGGGRGGGGGKGEKNTKRGLGRGWEGSYQVRSFEDTPE